MADYERGIRIAELTSKGMKPKEVTEILKAEGYNVTDNTVSNFLQNQMKMLKQEQREVLNKKVFDKPDVVYKNLEKILNDLDGLKDVLDEKREQVKYLEDSKELVNVINSSISILNAKTKIMEKALQKLGEIKSGVIRAENVNIEQKNIIFATNEAMKNILLDSNSEYVDGKIIINNPKPEIIDIFHKVDNEW